MEYNNMDAIEDKAERLKMDAAYAVIKDISLEAVLHIEHEYAVEVKTDIVKFISPDMKGKRYIIKVNPGYCFIILMVVNTLDNSIKEVKAACQETPENGR